MASPGLEPSRCEVSAPTARPCSSAVQQAQRKQRGGEERRKALRSVGGKLAAAAAAVVAAGAAFVHCSAISRALPPWRAGGSYACGCSLASHRGTGQAFSPSRWGAAAARQAIHTAIAIAGGACFITTLSAVVAACCAARLETVGPAATEGACISFATRRP